MRLSLLAQLLLWPSLAFAQPGSPAGPVPPERLASRREALLERLGTGVALLQGATERSIDPPDADYPQDTDFRQDNDFFYLTGLEVPGSWLLLIARTDGPDQVQLFLPPRNPAQERWLGARLGPGPEAAAVAALPVSSVRPLSDRDRVIDSLLSAPDSPGFRGTLFRRYNQREALVPAIQRLAQRAARNQDLLPHLAELRIIKDPDEIVRLRRAVEISAEGHLAAMRTAAPGAWEYELEAAAEYEFRRRGAERLGYPSIVGAGLTARCFTTTRAGLASGTAT